MKKSLLFSAAALCAAMNMYAEEIVYDFNNVAPQFAVDLYLPEEEPYFGYGKTGNVDIINKAGIPGEKFLEGESAVVNLVDGVEVVDASRVFDMETGVMVDKTAADLSHPLIWWTEKGCSRVLIMPVWGAEDGSVGGDYQAATEADYIATQKALAFNRMSAGNTGCRKDTYFQMPAVQGPFSMDVYIGSQGGKYATELAVKVVPVVDGTEGEETKLGIETDWTPKRIYKFTYNYDKNDAPIVRVGCCGHEVALCHVVIKTEAGAGVENVALDAAAENAPIYNTLGVQVDENYKGLVIKGGKKYIQK